MIEAKMAQLGTTNMGAYLRKMAIDGYVVKLDLPELRELVSLLRVFLNNLNQLTRRVHETGRVYAADMDDILQNQERIWQAASGILSRLQPYNKGVFIPCGAACCELGRPCFFVPRHPCNLEHIPVSCSHNTKRMEEKRDALSFEASVCAGHGCACRRVMVSCVRCRPLQRHPLHPRRHSRLFSVCSYSLWIPSATARGCW